jgi:hypothetical protein
VSSPQPPAGAKGYLADQSGIRARLYVSELPTHTLVMAVFTPSLSVVERGDRVRLVLEGIGHAEAGTLREAADELVRKALVIAMAVRAGEACPRSTDCLFDPSQLAFFWELGLIAAAGGDVRGRLFDPERIRAA